MLPCRAREAEQQVAGLREQLQGMQAELAAAQEAAAAAAALPSAE